MRKVLKLSAAPNSAFGAAISSMSSAFGKLNGGALSTMPEFHTQRASRPFGLSRFGSKEPIEPGKFSVTITNLYLRTFDNTELIVHSTNVERPLGRGKGHRQEVHRQ